jgi:hypothetical protein
VRSSQEGKQDDQVEQDPWQAPVGALSRVRITEIPSDTTEACLVCAEPTETGYQQYAAYWVALVMVKLVERWRSVSSSPA